MATYVNDLRLTELATGEGSGTWGTTTNQSLELIGEALGYATQQAFGSDADATTTVADGASDPARAMYYKITSAASLTATRTLTIAPNTISRVMFIENATSGSQSIAISQGSGASVTILTGKTAVVYLDGAGATAAVVDAMAGVDPGVTDTLTEVLVAGNTSGGTNIELSTTDKVQFRDAAIYINSSVDGQLDIVADTEIQIAATTVDINGAVDVSGTLGVTGVATLASLVATTADINAGTIDNTVIGGTTAAAISGTTGQFATSLNVDGTVTADGLTVDGATALNNISAGTTVATLSGQYAGSGDVKLLAFQRNGGAVAGAITYADASTGMEIGTTTSHTLALTTGDTQRLRIENNGDISFYDDTAAQGLFWDSSASALGIGTSSPSGKIDVSVASNQRIRFDDFGSKSRISSRNDAAAILPLLIDASDLILNSGSGGNVGIGVVHTQFNGVHSWYTAPSGTAGDAISFTQAMTLDASGNLLVGKTSTAFGTEGFVYEAGAAVEVTTDSNRVMRLNRTTNDGNILEFNKDGTTVGSIGVDDGDNLYIGGSAASHSGLYFGTNTAAPITAGTLTDAVTDLGTAGYRFKDLYLSGGVVFGDAGGSGTSSSNTLDSYEEGTWTPTVTSSGGTITSVTSEIGTYTKIGRLVTLQYQFNIATLGTASGNIIVSGRPFTEDNTAISYYGGVHRARSGTSSITEFDPDGTLQLYGTTPVAGVYYGSMVYNTTS
jgi:hypothetical protein